MSAGFLAESSDMELLENYGGARRIRTADQGFADPCLTTWLWRRRECRWSRVLAIVTRRYWLLATGFSGQLRRLAQLRGLARGAGGQRRDQRPHLETATSSHQDYGS